MGRYFLVDVEEEQNTAFISKKEVLNYIELWNENMETNYKNIEDFNDGEEYYTFNEVAIGS